MNLSHEQRKKRRKSIAEFCQKQQGYSQDILARAAKHYNVSVHLVYSACREHEVDIPKLNQNTYPKTFQILKCLLDGEKQTDIAAKFKVKQQRISQIKKEAEQAGIL